LQTNNLSKAATLVVIACKQFHVRAHWKGIIYIKMEQFPPMRNCKCENNTYSNWFNDRREGFYWQKEEDGHLPSVRSFDDDDLWRSMEDLMMIHGKLLKT